MVNMSPNGKYVTQWKTCHLMVNMSPNEKGRGWGIIKKREQRPRLHSLSEARHMRGYEEARLDAAQLQRLGHLESHGSLHTEYVIRDV